MVRLRAWVPFFLAAALYTVLLCVALCAIDAVTHGRQYYLLDDTYIHLAIAKNLLLHGVYGISATEPAMASSSILWPVLLVTAGKLFGLNLAVPLVGNILLSFALLAFAQHLLLRNHVGSARWQTATLALLVLGFPLVAMTLDGMEHVLFGLVFLWFLSLAGTALAGRDRLTVAQAATLLCASLLVTGCRYEGAFAVFITCLLMVWRRPLLAVAVAVAGLAPIVLFGLYSRSRGGMWVPNSLVMKTLDNGGALAKLLRIPHEMLTPYLLQVGLTGLLVLLAVLAVRGKALGLSAAQRSMLYVLLGAAAMHIQLAKVRTPTPRYESYLIGAGLVLGSLCVYSARNVLPQYLKAFAVLALLPVVLYRGVYWQYASVNAAVSIYRQQYQAAQFFARFYPGLPLVANDVGAVSYFADAQCFDIWGLGNNQVARERSANAFTTAEIARMAAQRHVQVGFLYDPALTGTAPMPADWVKVATWTIPTRHGNTTHSSTIYFYATSRSAAQTLAQNLADFQPGLPSQVTTRMLAH